MLATVRNGGTELIHTPHFDGLTDEDAQTVKDAGTVVSSCTGFGAPVFNVFNHDNIPTFRDGKPWPSGIIDGQGRGREAGYKPVNGRRCHAVLAQTDTTKSFIRADSPTKAQGAAC